MSDDYLWDRSGEPDPEVQRLERVLGRHRWKGAPALPQAQNDNGPAEAGTTNTTTAPTHEVGADEPVRASRPRLGLRARRTDLEPRALRSPPLEVRSPAFRRAVPGWIAAAACVVAAAGAAAWLARGPGVVPAPAAAVGFDVARVEGVPRVGGRSVEGGAVLPVGGWLETDATSRATVEVADIGHVDVGPGSRLRLVATGDDEHRLELARGSIEATIFAPPRLFFVDTPSAVAVDLGCRYTLDVAADGTGLLRVLAGWVSFERDGRESIVPADALCTTRPEIGPGTPHFDDAPAELRSALDRFDVSGDAGAVAEVSAAARPRDTLTLWHLLARAAAAQRPAVYERTAELSPPPPGVTREGVLALDSAMLVAWREDLERLW